jgi:superfamily II DNA or RNA helicase/very-short-patch-repair endonuclease
VPDPEAKTAWWHSLGAASFLEYAFLRWILAPAVSSNICTSINAQREIAVGDRCYRIDYEIRGVEQIFAIELDGFEFHGDRQAFSYDRLRQNDLHAAGRMVVRFSYDSIRSETERCVSQLQSLLGLDPFLRGFLRKNPIIETPEMAPDPLNSFQPSPLFGCRTKTQKRDVTVSSYFEAARQKLNLKTLRQCQSEAFAALGNYYGSGGKRAACVMSVGAGKTALGVLAYLAFSQRRAMIVTPGSVIRGTFDQAFDHEAVRNVLYGLPAGPLIPGHPPPSVLTLDRDVGPIRAVTREQLAGADVVLTNFHSLGTGDDPDDLLSKLSPEDIDYIVVDEAHIAAAESYQRTFRHFDKARSLLMSACFQRLDGKPIDADVVYRYRLIDSIADGNAKNLRVQRFAPNPEQTTYEIVWPDGVREEIFGKNSLLDMIKDERKLARITAKSNEPIRQIMRAVTSALAKQRDLLNPIKPRVLFAALGERHAEQIASIAQEHGIPCAHLHHSMTEARIKSIRSRFETESGDLQGIVQLKMLGQGYDFPPITIVIPMRPYGSFAEFYQFIGRGIRVISHPALVGRTAPGQQFLDIIYHAELGLDEHIETIYRENDMDPNTLHELPPSWSKLEPDGETLGSKGFDTAQRPEAFVLFEQGALKSHLIHDQDRVERRREERELEALAQRYARYAQTSPNPLPFEKYVEVVKSLNE